MRSFRPLAAVALLVLGLAAAPSARPDGGEDGPITDDLLCCFRPFSEGFKFSKHSMRSHWTDWWFANRRALTKPATRAGSTSAGPAPDDPAARARAREALLAAFASENQFVSSEAALALGRFGDARDIPALAKIVADPDVAATRRMHRCAALGLGMLPLGDEAQAATARNALLGAIDSARGKHHQFCFFFGHCAYALAMRGDKAALPELVSIRERAFKAVNMQGTIYVEVLGSICYAMAALGGETSLPEIQEHLEGRRSRDGGSNDTSWHAAQALARVGGETARQLLLSAAREKEQEFRRCCAFQALGSIATPRDDEIAAVLREGVAKDKDMNARRMAVISLGRSGHATAGPALLDAYDNGQGEDRPFVGVALGLLARRTPDPKISKFLADELKQSSTDDAQGALSLGCALAGVPGVQPRLAEILGGGGPRARPLAAWALGVLGAGPAERKVLHASVAQPGLELERREAALALGTLHDHSVVDQLRAIASSHVGDKDKAGALACLGRVGDDADIDFVVAFVTDKGSSDGLRAAAVHALGWLVDRTDYAALSRIAADVKWVKQDKGNNLNWTGDAVWEIQHLVD